MKKWMWVVFVTGRMGWALIGGVDSVDPASILFHIDEERIATGTLVGPKTVLMAGHSIFETPVEKVKVYQWVNTDEGKSMVELGIGSQKKVHPLYTGSETRQYDVALLTFEGEAEAVGEPYLVSVHELERDVPFRMSGHGAIQFEGRASVKQRTGTNTLPGKEAPELERLKSEAWIGYGLLRFYGVVATTEPSNGENATPGAGDSGLGLIQDGEVRAVFSGSHYDPEVRQVAAAAVPLSSEKNRAFLEEALDEGFAFTLVE